MNWWCSGINPARPVLVLAGDLILIAPVTTENAISFKVKSGFPRILAVY